MQCKIIQTKQHSIWWKGEKHGEQLFWIPASHPYYKIPANNMFAKNHDFSKVLVFSAWEMVPRMIACMISYAVEQKSISRAFPSATYTNTKENSEKDALDKQQGEKPEQEDYVEKAWNW